MSVAFCRIKIALTAASLLLTYSAAWAVPAIESAAMQPPASDAAVVAKLAGLVNNRHSRTLTGMECVLNEGIVIRQSIIRDGQIVIPPEGLYTTVRSSHNFFPFDSEPYSIAGKNYHVIVDRYVRDVIRDVVMKKGERITSNANKSRGWELTAVGGWSTYGLADGKSAVFNVLKTTGNYYGADFHVYVGSSISNAAADGTLVYGSGQPSGHTIPDEANGLSRFDYGSNVASVGRSWVVVDHIGPDDSVYVKEFATDSNTDVFISPQEPLVGAWSAGDSFMAGESRVNIEEVRDESAVIAITDPSGATVRKRLYIDPVHGKWLIQSMVEREKCFLLSQDGSTLVHLHIRPGAPFNGGKVTLVSYSGVIRVQDGSIWPGDERFLARPETCATCTYSHEIVLANRRAIVLDGKTHKEFTGPQGHFKIVIDNFDGKTVKAWHLETSRAKTGNLATRSGGRHIDLVVGKACRSTAHFLARWYSTMYDEHLEGKDVFK